MLFNSGVFLKFFSAFLLLYYLGRNNLRFRNILIVAASYLFYGWWDYRFLCLLVATSLLDYGIGLGLERWPDPKKRKSLVTLSIVANLSILGFFKYFGFFVDSFRDLLGTMGLAFNLTTLEIVLPVGISFYTFQSFSYTIDVYRGEIKAARNPVNFLAFVSFFPQLVAGPIERARHLLPQFEEPRRITISMIEEGIWLCLWGMFKKVVLADNLAPLVELVYGRGPTSGLMVMLGTLAFGFQIYCDFSGYSDIARGAARILGFDIMVNFHLPYTATNVREFWRKWHISLSTWLRDYLYISLGGNRDGTVRTCGNLMLTMLLGGLWHGAAWNFVFWGFWHGAGLVIHRLWSGRTSARGVMNQPTPAPRPGGELRTSGVDTVPLPGRGTGVGRDSSRGPVWIDTLAFLRRVAGWFVTMSFVFYGWLLFRAGSSSEIVSLTRALFDFSSPVWIESYLVNLAVFILPLVLVELWQHRSKNLLSPLTLPHWLRAFLQGALLIAIILYWEKEKLPFIYFQF
ncbi:MAG: MBOAT family protein [Verrucomicrobia bacterium]|nr:MBOAT family protein [Verrucomicrobiota bacterium]